MHDINITADMRQPINLDQLSATLLALVDELDEATQDRLAAEGAKLRAGLLKESLSQRSKVSASKDAA